MINNQLSIINGQYVLRGRFELPQDKTLTGPKPVASANSATSAIHPCF